MHVPKSTFALAALSPFQPGFGSLQMMSIHQDTASGLSNSSLIFSVTDQGDAEDLAIPQKCVDVSPELVSTGYFCKHFVQKLITECLSRHISHVSQSYIRQQQLEMGLKQKVMFADTMQESLLVSIDRL